MLKLITHQWIILKKADIYRNQLEIEDPLVLQLGIQAGLDLEYVEMVNAIENMTEFKDLPDHSEARLIHDSMHNA